MLRIAILVPEQGYFPGIFEIFARHKEDAFSDSHRQDPPLHAGEEYHLEEIVIQPDKINIAPEIDAVITRGGVVNIVRDAYPTIPVVEVDVPSIDIAQLLVTCRSLYGQCKVGIVAVKSMMLNPEAMSQLVDMPIYIAYTDHIINYKAIVNEIKEHDCDVLIGDYYTCCYAQQLGMPTLHNIPSREVLWKAFSQAKLAARRHHYEQERTSRLNSVLDYVHEGVILLDSKKSISSINKIAMQMIGIHDLFEYIDPQSACNYLPENLKNMILDGSEYENDIIQINKNTIMMNKNFVQLKGNNMGVIVLLQQCTSIQQMEHKIRNQSLRQGHVAKAHFHDIVGTSPAIMKMIKTAKKYSQSLSSVLLLGASGTGKEILAQSIHNASSRHDKPFVAINCAALPETLLESELFGYAEGAFTGAARRGKAGLVETAHGGTLFLDEIAEMPPSLQCKLLRVLQERCFSRLGSTMVVPVDVRIISATNRNLKQMVRKGHFREDLYYRINVLQIYLPTLNERREDIPLLVDAFFKSYPEMHISPQVKDFLRNHNWEGNVRELFNICEQLAVLSKNGAIGTETLNDIRLDEDDANDADPAPDSDTEAARIQRILVESRYNYQRAAALLHINRTTLWRKMKKYNIPG